MCIEARVGLHILLLIEDPLNDSQGASCIRADGRVDGTMCLKIFQRSC